ncbi:hypothetical protein [Massilia sp. S19_KUP03_FR1]|uniref:hypothetical protein n=1 Tax=Massilia sp. S19_KUP03_FR1 TaxID=3025503 RepID=UPI002FCD5D38
MSPLSPYANMRAAGQGFIMGSAVSAPMIAILACTESQGVAGLVAYCAAGASMGGVLVGVATLLDRLHIKRRAAVQPPMSTNDAQRLKDCEVMIQALQAGLMRCAGAAGPETLNLVSARFNEIVMAEIERQRQTGITPHWEERKN